MIPKIEITVKGVAATQRPRIAAGGRSMYNVPAVKRWKAAVKEAAFMAMLEAGRSQFPIPVGTSVTAIYKFYLPWQKNTPKKVALTYGDHTQKPDLKNLLSHTEDAISEAGVWTDDNQVDEIPMRKWRCPRGEERVDITVSW